MTDEMKTRLYSVLGRLLIAALFVYYVAVVIDIGFGLGWVVRPSGITPDPRDGVYP